MVDGQRLHLAEVRGLDGGEVVFVVDPVVPVRKPEHLWIELRIGAASVQVVLARPEVGEHGRHATRGGGLALALGVAREGRVDPHVGVGVDDTGEAEQPAAVSDLAGLAGGDFVGDAREPAVLHADVEPLHAGLTGPDHADVLDEQVERRRRHRRARDPAIDPEGRRRHSPRATRADDPTPGAPAALVVPPRHDVSYSTRASRRATSCRAAPRT